MIMGASNLSSLGKSLKSGRLSQLSWMHPGDKLDERERKVLSAAIEIGGINILMKRKNKTFLDKMRYSW
jgi:hypothetical protein